MLSKRIKSEGGGMISGLGKIKKSVRILGSELLVIILGLSVLLFPASAQAGSLNTRSLTLSSSAAGGTGVTYTFGFTPQSSTTVKSVNIDICDSASNTCSPAGTGVPTGLTSTGAAVGSVSGIGSGGSWTGTFTTNGQLRIANSSNTGSPGTVSLQFTGVTNPTTTNTTYYARITTYSDSAWSTPIDGVGAGSSGVVAASTANQITVSGTVDETLTFCTGTSGITSSSCAGATGTSVGLGTLSTGSVKTGTSQIGVATNAGSGYAITYSGATLTSGSNTITACSAGCTSSAGTSQYGFDLRANTSPSVGSNPAGAGTANPVANYNTNNTFRFASGDSVVTNGSADDFRLFTVSYIANIANTTPAGVYSSTVTWVATATF